MNEEKIARICWNSNNWQSPSGKKGKVASRSSGAYEKENGYGHEEWLFDMTKLVDGFHYAFIQAIGQHRAKYEGQKFNISFYTINSAKKERWWLGEIHDIQVISETESKLVYSAYKKNGWLKEMYAQLLAVGANLEEFKRTDPANFACVKFRPRDCSLLEEPRCFLSTDPAVKSDYYNLKNKVGNPQGIESGKFQFTPGSTIKKGATTASYSSREKDVDLVHNQIQASMIVQLRKEYGKDNVSGELGTGYGTKVDVAVRSGEVLIFFELKTANTSKQCIREALSQLLEYAYFPCEARASKLVIVGPVDLSDDSRKYLTVIREKFSIPVYYRKFDIEKKNLGADE